MTPADFRRGIAKYIRSDLVSLGAYTPHKAPETMKQAGQIIKLDANENPYGASPKVQRALAEYIGWHLYPDAAQTTLRRQLAKYTGAPEDCIVAANGSGELLDYILCLLLEPGDEVINCPPTFDLYRVRTIINGGKLVTVPRNPDFSVNINAVRAAITPKTKLIVLASPNSPTGTLTPDRDILDLLDNELPVLVDEAYYEFCRQSVIGLLKDHRNLLVLRTCSKWAGLAGLRVGYGIFAPEIAAALMKIKLPYNVNLAALVAVQATMTDVDYLMGRVRDIIAERERLAAELKKLKWLKPFPSCGNFILCAVLQGKAVDIQAKLETKGILVRYFDQPLVANCIRVSVGKPEHNDAFLKALKEIGG